jgi:hypothetical protein
LFIVAWMKPEKNGEGCGPWSKNNEHQSVVKV